MLAVAPVCIAAFANYPAAINVPLIHANIKTVTSRFLKKDSVCAMHVHSKKFCRFSVPIGMLQPLPQLFFKKEIEAHLCILMSVSLAVVIAQALPDFFFFLQKQDRATHVHCLYFLPLVYCSHCRNFFLKKSRLTRACSMTVSLAVFTAQPLP